MVIALLGAAIFTAMFASSFADRADLEKAAIFAIQKKVQAEVRTKYPAVENDSFQESAEFLRDKFEDRGAAWKAALDAKMDVAVAQAVSRYCGCDTVTQEKQASITGFFKTKNQKAIAISERLEGFIKGKYEATVSGLIRDIRIFSAVNVGAFVLIFCLAWLRPGARFHLILPAGLVLISTVLTICLYVVGQNWFYTLMLGNFWGFAYLAYMAIIFALTLDITLNHGRVTTTILNSLSNITIVPC